MTYFFCLSTGDSSYSISDSKMHELDITQSMLDLVLEEAKKLGAKKVDHIPLVIGEMSGVVDESVEFYFGFFSKDTIAEGAVLSFKHMQTQARCRKCGEVFALTNSNWVCPTCNDSNMEILTGAELYIESIGV